MRSASITLLLLLAPAGHSLRIGAALRRAPSRSTSPSASIAVFGASGGTGSEAVLQALERGEEVTCLVRDRTKLKSPRSAAGFSEGAPFGGEALTVLQGDVTKKGDVDAVF